jgi:cyclic pyranopterin phosphate synthase
MKLSHIDKDGNAVMVDVSNKESSKRIAQAKGTITMQPETLKQILDDNIKKGNVLTVAKVAGIMAAKNTANIVPMCHPLLLTGIEIRYEVDKDTSSIHVLSTVKTIGNTGVEIEALNAVNTTLLTIYDMVKAIDKTMTFTNIKVTHKSGGKTGEYNHEG